MALNAHTTNCALWNSRIAEYERRAALLKANRSFGALALAYRSYETAKGAHTDRFGATRSPEASASWESIWAALGVAEDDHFAQFIYPCDIAAIALATTPAPDTSAAVYKVDLIIKHELDNHTGMTADPMTIVAEDMARLAA